VASARRAGSARQAAPAAVAVAEREGRLPGRVEGDVVIESPASVGPEPGSGATMAPRPGARPQRPGNRRSGGKKRR
jgi:preprotein translocase subunit SecF